MVKKQIQHCDHVFEVAEVWLSLCTWQERTLSCDLLFPLVARALEEADCLLDPERTCLADTHPDLFAEVLDFLRYWDLYPLQLSKNKILARGSGGIRELFKWVDISTRDWQISSILSMLR